MNLTTQLDLFSRDVVFKFDVACKEMIPFLSFISSVLFQGLIDKKSSHFRFRR